MNLSANVCMCVCVCEGFEGAGCSFDSPTQLAQLLGVGVERERERGVQCEFCVEEKRKKLRALFSLDSHVKGNEQTGEKEDKEQPCHCFGLTCIKFCPRSPPQSQESLSLSPL